MRWCCGKPAIVSDRVGTVWYDEIARLEHIKVVEEPNVQKAAEAIAEAIANLDSLEAAAQQARPAAFQEFMSWDRVARLHLRKYELRFSLRRCRRIRRNGSTAKAGPRRRLRRSGARIHDAVIDSVRDETQAISCVTK